MKRTLRGIHGHANHLGPDALAGAANLCGVPGFVTDLQTFMHVNRQPALWPMGATSPCLKDRFNYGCGIVVWVRRA